MKLKVILFSVFLSLFVACGNENGSSLEIDERTTDSFELGSDIPIGNTENEEDNSSNPGGIEPSPGNSPIPSTPEIACPQLVKPQCGYGKKSIAITSLSGCKRFICVLDIEPKLAAIPEHGENDLWKLPTAPNEATNEVCKLSVWGPDNRPSDRYIAPNSTHVAYVRLSTSQYAPHRGRYRLGRNLVCELMTITCSTSKSIRRTPSQVRYLLDNDGSRCKKGLFDEHPEHNYRYYKQLFEFVSDVYQTCQSRAPTREETTHVLDAFIEENITESEAVESICR